MPRLRRLKVKACWAIAALAAGPAGLLGQTKTAAPPPGSDIELWSEVDLTADFANRWSLLVPLVARNSDSLPNPALVGFGASISVAIDDLISLTGGYLFVDLPNTAGGLTANVPLAAVTLSHRLGRLEFADRNRGERLIGIPGNPFRYRNRLSVQRRIASGAWRLFASDEAFYDFGAGRWNQNRLQAGAGRALNRRATVDIYYLERNLHAQRPGTAHAIGVTLGLRLR